MSKYFCYQGNDHDCGFASLKMLLATINKNKSFLRLRNPFKNQSYSFSNLIDIALQYGVTMSGYKCVNKDIDAIKPVSLALIDSNHLVLVNKLTTKFIYVNDPDKGKLKLRLNEFKSRWSGELLEVDSFIPYYLSIPKITIISPISNVISYFLSTLGVASLVIGLYFVKSDSFIFIPLILLTIFMIIELVENWYLIKIINNFDNRYIPLYFNSENSCQESYKTYSNFKANYFSIYRKLFATFLLSAIIVVSLIINDAHNCVMILSLLLIIIIEKMLFYKRDCKKKIEITHLESLALTDPNSNPINDIKNICSKSSKFALNFSIRKCINTFIVLIICFLLMLFAGEVSTNYILFHFGLYYILLTNLNILLDADWTLSDFNKDKARFIDKCNL